MLSTYLVMPKYIFNSMEFSKHSNFIKTPKNYPQSTPPSDLPKSTKSASESTVVYSPGKRPLEESDQDGPAPKRKLEEDGIKRKLFSWQTIHHLCTKDKQVNGQHEGMEQRFSFGLVAWQTLVICLKLGERLEENAINESFSKFWFWFSIQSFFYFQTFYIPKFLQFLLAKERFQSGIQ